MRYALLPSVYQSRGRSGTHTVVMLVGVGMRAATNKRKQTSVWFCKIPYNANHADAPCSPTMHKLALHLPLQMPLHVSVHRP
jgi:hypothetical protein